MAERTGLSVSRSSAGLAGWLAALVAMPGVAQPPRSIASINLCADQLVLSVADPGQILTVSWLAADPQESMLAAEASRFPLNYGSAEELLRFDPDVVVAGALTNEFVRGLLRRLGYEVVEIAPARSIADIERNLRTVGDAVGQRARAEGLIAALQDRSSALQRSRPASAVAAVVVRPGGFTVGANSLADELIRLAGLRNVAADRGLDRWGSLSMETLMVSEPSLIIYADYRRDDASLANSILEHPALARLGERVPAVTIAGSYWACGLPDSLESVDLLRAALPSAR